VHILEKIQNIYSVTKTKGDKDQIERLITGPNSYLSEFKYYGKLEYVILLSAFICK